MHYNGADYTDVKANSEVLQNETNDDILTIQARYSCRVPKGYDGLVATVSDSSKLDDRELIADTSQIKNDNPCFRLK